MYAGNAVLQHQFALFHAPQGQRIGQSTLLHGFDRLVQITMFAPKYLQLDPQDVFGLHRKIRLVVHAARSILLMRYATHYIVAVQFSHRPCSPAFFFPYC